MERKIYRGERKKEREKKKILKKFITFQLESIWRALDWQEKKKEEEEI